MLLMDWPYLAAQCHLRSVGMIRTARVYDPPDESKGNRILVDRLWPRGLKKAETQLDDWMRDVAPSNELRRWYGHDQSRWPEFERRYEAELAEPNRGSSLNRLEELARKEDVSLLSATKDLEHSNAAVLARVLKDRLAR